MSNHDYKLAMEYATRLGNALGLITALVTYVDVTGNIPENTIESMRLLLKKEDAIAAKAFGG